MLFKQDCFTVNTVNMVLQMCNLSVAIWNAMEKHYFLYDLVVPNIRVSGCKQEDINWKHKIFFPA